MDKVPSNNSTQHYHTMKIVVVMKVSSKQQPQKDYILNVNPPTTVDYGEEEENAPES